MLQSAAGLLYAPYHQRTISYMRSLRAFLSSLRMRVGAEAGFVSTHAQASAGTFILGCVLRYSVARAIHPTMSISFVALSSKKGCA